jgi:hypothetical protein
VKFLLKEYKYVIGGFETREKAEEFAIHNDYVAFVATNEEVFELVNNIFDLRKKQSRYSILCAREFPLMIK